ncbi:hypothetical protein D9M73_159530 [compost metagenome]
MSVSGLGDEHRSHGQVDRRTVEVERVAGRNHQAYHRLLRTQTLHLDQHARQHRLRRGSTQHNQQLFTDVADHLQHAEAMQAGNRTQHDQDEQQACNVEAGHQLAQLHQRADTVGTDGEGHGTEGTDRRELHDHVDDVEHHMGEAIDQVQQRLAVGTQAMQGETEDHREHQHLQDIAVGEGADYGVRDDVEQEADRGLLRAGGGISGHAAGVQGADVDMHAGARLDHVHHHQANDQGDGRDDFEIEQRVATGLAHRLHALHASDTADHSAEDDRGNDHFDQFDEPVTQRFQGNAGLRVEVAQQDTDGDRY